MAPPKGSKAKRREDKTLRRVRLRSGIRSKGSAERERVRALKARDARLRASEKSRLRESERSTSHGANTLTEAKPVPTPSQSSGCAHEDTHAHRERVRLAPQAYPMRRTRPARETRIPFETDPAREARPMREAMQVPETGYANEEWTTRTCEAGLSRASGQTREVDAESEWLEDLAEHLKTMGKDKVLRDLLACDDKKESVQQSHARTSDCCIVLRIT